MPLTPPILEVADLTVRYGDRVALTDVAFAVRPGERMAVVGPNGGGKSTLLKAITGLIDVTAGRITLRDGLSGPDGCIAYVPQRADLDWSFPVTVGDVVLMGRAHRVGWLRRPGNEDRAAVARALDAVGIADLATRRIRDLSGGQQQRMLIARALAQEARLVLMDEPFNNLDPASAGTILSVLEDLSADGVAVIIAMHDLALAEARFDSAVLLSRRMVACGVPRDVLTEDHLQAAYGAALRIVEGPDGNRILSDPGCHDDDHVMVTAPAGARRVATGIAAPALGVGPAAIGESRGRRS